LRLTLTIDAIDHPVSCRAVMSGQGKCQRRMSGEFDITIDQKPG
jgi:hypothetical protein